MSRTFRRAKASDKYLLAKHYVLYELNRQLIKFVPLDSQDPKVLEKIKKFQSDRGHRFTDFRGPSWFYRDFVQVPYRANARTQLRRAIIDPDYEVILESKPTKRVYWL